MKRLTLILILLALLPVAAMADWTGTTSTQWDLAANWNGTLPSGGTTEARLEGYGTTPPGNGWPVIDSAINTQWGLLRVRGPGLHLTQTGGTHEWLNGSGISSRGMNLFSRPVTYPTGAGPNNPTIVTLTGGTMITDAVGLGTTTSSTYYNQGGDYMLDTGTYRNWQTTAGDNAYGWGRLEIGGTATFIVRPNRYISPATYIETTPYWSYSYNGDGPNNLSSRDYDIAISTGSTLVLSGGGELVAPLKLFDNDRDVLAQLQYYQSIGRFIAGPGESLLYTLFPGDGMQDGIEGGLLGGYFTVTAIPEPGSLALLGLGLAGLLVLRRRS